MQKGLVRVGVLSIEEVRDLFIKSRMRQVRYLEVNGFKIRISNYRYKVFLETSGTECKKCGKEASYFAIEKLEKQIKYPNLYFLNLYGKNKKDEDLLYTVDHIIPRAKFGRSTFENFQTLCLHCNSAKGDKIPKDFLNRIKKKNLNKMISESGKVLLNLC